MHNRDLFWGFEAKEKEELLRLLDAKEEQYKKGDIVIAPTEVLKSFAIVKKGSVSAYQLDSEGKEVLLSVIQSGGCLATSLAFLGVPSPVTVIASEDSTVLWLNVSPLRENNENGLVRRLFLNFALLMAEDVLKMNERIRVITQPNIKKKLMGFLELYQKIPGEEFTVPMDRAAMAAYIGADRSALSRVISGLQSEKRINCVKNRFQILY
ncbi:MAG: Crp/Fnr family transcriptional regulator [Eubacteriales bacterium]|nr:Crp/Fnr family transcriptional regulator [Eubacteriales bacterium]